MNAAKPAAGTTERTMRIAPLLTPCPPVVMNPRLPVSSVARLRFALPKNDEGPHSHAGPRGL